MKKLFFSAGKETLAAIIASSKSKPVIFFFHGGGIKNEKEKLLYLMRDLMKKGVNSLAFDFSGVNESTGLMSSSNLEKRVQEARVVIEKYYSDSEKVNICAFSMGGYVAIKITELIKVKNLILFCPAVYNKRAYKVNFGDGFSKIIRKNKSWKNSDAWTILEKYKDNLLLFVPENDEIVPREISDLIYSSALNSKSRKMIILPEFSHGVHSWIVKKRKIRQGIIGEMVKKL
jgi:uncharacterized protein